MKELWDGWQMIASSNGI